MNPYLGVATAFVMGAAVTWFLGRGAIALRIEQPPTDAQLREQVRARLRELVSYPEAVQVSVEGGIVRVSGRVLAREVDHLLMRLTDLPGVYKVHNALSTLDDLGALDEVQDIERRSAAGLG